MTPVAESGEVAYEVERGKPMPSLNHGVIQARLTVEFSRSDEFMIASELTMAMEEKPDLVPDISVLPMRPLDRYDDHIRETEPPLMVVEIVSPTQSSYSVMDRARRCFDHGVKSFWLVDPTQQCVTVRSADGGDELFSSPDEAVDPTTGLKADLAKVFA